VERIGNGRGAQQRGDLLLALPDLQLGHGIFPDQVALIDGLLVDDAAPGGGQGDGGDQQEIAHRDWRLGKSNR
jgi:hypothetical protein